MKGKKARRTAALLLALALFAAAPKAGLPLQAQAATLSELQQEQKELAQKQKELAAQLDALREDKAKQQEYKNALDEQVANLQSQIDGLNGQISLLDASINEKSAAIAEKQQNIDQNVEILKERLCALYMAGEASNLEIILNSESVMDMAEKIELMNMITEHDTNLIASLSTEMEEISAEKAEIESQKTQGAEPETAAPVQEETSEIRQEQEEASAAPPQNSNSVSISTGQPDQVQETPQEEPVSYVGKILTGSEVAVAAAAEEQKGARLYLVTRENGEGYFSASVIAGMVDSTCSYLVEGSDGVHISFIQQ